jgi:hypothetical protein
MRMKARKEKTRWHQKICLSRSWWLSLQSGYRQGNYGGKVESSSMIREEEFVIHFCSRNLLEKIKIAFKQNAISLSPM